MTSERVPTLGALGCCALSLAFRIPSLSWGLPYLFHPDEPTNFSVVQRMLKQHTANPHFFKYPSLFFYANALVELAHYAVCRALGVLHSMSELPDLDVPIDGSGLTTLPSAFFVARLLSTACGVATVWVVYRIGRALAKEAGLGVLCALLVAVSPSLLRDSRWIAPDGMVTLAATATVLAALNVLQRGAAKDYVWASVLAGLTASLKYNGGLVGVAVCVAAVLRDGRRAFRTPWLYLAPLIALASFLLTSPYIALDYREFLRDFLSERKHYATGHAGAEGNTLAFYYQYLAEWEGLSAWLAIGALILGVARRSKEIAVLAAFCLVYFGFINLFVTRNGQTLVPMVPTLLVLAAWFVHQCLVFVGRLLRERKLSRPARWLLAGVVVAVVVGTPLAGSIRKTRPLLLKDNRELATVWLEANVAPHSHIAIERYACYVNRKRYALKATLNLSSLEPSWLRRHMDYAIFAGDSFNRFITHPELYGRQAEKYKRLFEELELVKAFDDPRRGAEVRIYRTSKRQI